MNCTCYIYIFVVDKQSKQGPKVFSKIFILAMSIFKYWKDQTLKAEKKIEEQNILKSGMHTKKWN